MSFQHNELTHHEGVARAVEYGGEIAVEDGFGAIWWPNDDAAAEIAAAANPSKCAVRICDAEPTRGTWHC